MFSENRKISSRQAAALFQADWLGRLVLFLPLLVQGKSKEAVLAGGLAGFLLLAGLLGVFCTGARAGGQDYYEYVCRAAGRTYGNFLYLVYVLYFLLQTGILLYLCSAAARLYLLPDVSFWVLPLLPGLAGFYLAGGGMEVRGRLSQMLSGFVGILLLLLLAVSLLQIKGERLLERQSFSFLEMAQTAVFWAGSFGELGILPVVLSVTQKEKGWKRRLYQTLGFSSLILLLVFLAGYGIFGQAGMERLEWPALSLMSTSNLQGVFFQRWDVLAVGLLMMSLFLAVGSGLYYLGLAGTCLLGGKQGEKEKTGIEKKEREETEKEETWREVGEKEAAGKEEMGREVGEKEAAGKEEIGREVGEKEAAEKEETGREVGEKEAAGKEETGREAKEREEGETGNAETVIKGRRKKAAGKGNAGEEPQRGTAKERERKQSGEIKERRIRLAGFLGSYGLSVILLFQPEGRMAAGELSCFFLAPLMITLVLLVRPIQRVRWRKRRAKWKQ